MSAHRSDVIVVGGGPGGSATAALFARAGWDVRLLERSAFPRFKACGDFLSPEGTRILRRLEVEEAVCRAGARRLRGLLVSTRGEPALRADFDGEHAFGYALERSAFDAALRDGARRAGADVLERWTAVGLAAPGELRVVSPEGVPTRMRARLLVGAGGMRCPVARDLGVQRRPRHDGRVDLLRHWHTQDGEGAYCEMHVAGPGYIGMAPSAPGLLNVNTVLPRSWMREWRRARSAVSTRLPRTDLRRELYDELVLAVPAARRALRGAVPAGTTVASDVTPLVTTRASAEAALLVGDAALFIDPFTGQGLYLALRSAELAFEVGAAALRASDVSGARLARYDALRRREFSPKVTLSRALQAILYRPWLARRVAGALRRDRRGAERLIGVVGDYRPARELLDGRFLLRLATAALA